jgi:hypothetical protein
MQELYPSVGTDKERQQRNLLSIGQVPAWLSLSGLALVKSLFSSASQTTMNELPCAGVP